MPFYQTLLFCALGVAISIVLPVMRRSLPGASAAALGSETFLSRFWVAAKPYFLLAIFSLIVSVLVLAIAAQTGKTIDTWSGAILTGYVSDSTLQKFKG